MHKIQEPPFKPANEEQQAGSNCRCGCGCSNFQLDGQTMNSADFISNSSSTLIHAHYKAEES